MIRLIAACWLMLLLVSPGWGKDDDEDDLRNAVYHGQVVDVDTGRSLEGVLVAVFWYRKVHSPTTLYVDSEFHAATEVLSDTDGRFSVSGAPGAATGPSIVHVDAPEAVFFKPGYVLHQIRRRGDPRHTPMLVYMRQADDPKDAVNLHLVADFPYDRMPMLLKALNLERSRLGLSPIHLGTGEKRR